MYIYIYKYRARTGLPGEVRLDSAGPVFYALWDVGGMTKWLTRLLSETQNPKPQILNPKS